MRKTELKAKFKMMEEVLACQNASYEDAEIFLHFNCQCGKISIVNSKDAVDSVCPACGVGFFDKVFKQKGK